LDEVVVVTVKLIGLSAFKLNWNQFFLKLTIIKTWRVATPLSETDRTMNLQEQLEKEGERKVAALIDVSEQTLLAIIDEGNDAFKAVHGRNMTYAEMRGLYG